MPSIPYRTDDQAGTGELVNSIRKRRGGTLLNLDRLLLYSPPFARGWNALLGAVRNELSLAPKLRELAMCGVAILNGADYEFIHHAPEFVRAGGSEAQVEALRGFGADGFDAALFGGIEGATLALTAEMTRGVSVDDGTFAALRAHLPDAQIVELVGVIAAYNMVSRFLVALGVEPEA